MSRALTMRAEAAYKVTIERRQFLPSARVLALGVAAALFIALCALPASYMLLVSFISADGSLSLDNYHRLLAESRQRELLLTSTLLGTGAASLATVVGAPL